MKDRENTTKRECLYKPANDEFLTITYDTPTNKWIRTIIHIGPNQLRRPKTPTVDKNNSL